MSEKLELEQPRAIVRHEYVPESREVEDHIMHELIRKTVWPKRPELHFPEEHYPFQDKRNSSS